MSKVLLIEPNHVLATTFGQALEHVGHSVVLAAGAQEALDAADAQQPDVVVLELQLVGTDGIGFLHEFRSYEEWRNIPVVINSYTSPDELHAVKEILTQSFGVFACLYKPRATLEKLVQTVNDAVRA